MPPLLHSAMVREVTFAPDGSSLLTVAGFSDVSIRLWELPRDDRPVSAWTELARFFGGNRAGEGSGLDMTTGAFADPKPAGRPNASAAETTTHEKPATKPPTLAEAWSALRQKYPEEFALSDADLDAWERHAASRAEERRDWSAAVEHLTRLIQAHPNAGEFAWRRAMAYTRWADGADPADSEQRVRQAVEDYGRVIGWVNHHREIATQSRKPVLLERSKLLRQLGRIEEAQADVVAAEGNPRPKP